MSVPHGLPENATDVLRRLDSGSVPWEVAGITLWRYLFDHPEEKPLVRVMSASELEDLLTQMMASARDHQSEAAKDAVAAYMDDRRQELKGRLPRPDLLSLEESAVAQPTPGLAPVGIER